MKTTLKQTNWEDITDSRMVSDWKNLMQKMSERIQVLRIMFSIKQSENNVIKGIAGTVELFI